MSEETGPIDGAALQGYVGRVLVLQAERKAVNGDIAAVYAEAKSAGLVSGIIRQIVREKQMDEAERAASYSLADAYRRALGLLADTPLGEAAISASSRVEEEGYPGSLVPKRPRPKPFAEQPVGAGMRSTAPIRKGRGRPRKHRGADELALAEPAGAAE